MVERGDYGSVVVTAEGKYQGQCGYYDSDEGKHAKVIMRLQPNGPPDGPMIVVEHGEMMVDVTVRRETSFAEELATERFNPDDGPAKPVEDVLEQAAGPEGEGVAPTPIEKPPLGPVPERCRHRHAGLMRVSIEILEDWLDLPAGVRLRGMLPEGHHYDLPSGIAVLYLVDETGVWLPDQLEGAQAAWVSPEYVKGADGRPVLLGFDCGSHYLPVPADAPRQQDEREPVFFREIKKLDEVLDDANAQIAAQVIEEGVAEEDRRFRGTLHSDDEPDESGQAYRCPRAGGDDA